MTDQQDRPRESIWSLRQLSLIRYYLAFAVLFALATGLQLWRSFATRDAGTYFVDTALASLKETSGLTPWLIIFTYYLVEGVSMLAERYLRSRYAKGRDDGREEERERWQTWNLRREEALQEGREFNEPPPGETGKVQK